MEQHGWTVNLLSMTKWPIIYQHFSTTAAKAPAPVDWDMENTTLVLNISERVSLNNLSAQYLKIGSANNPGSLYFGSGKLQQPYSSSFRLG
jgi:hypothetical protein